MPQYLYRIQPARLEMLTDGPTESEASVIGEHFRYLQGLVEQGVVLMAGRTLNTDEKSFGIAVFVAASEAEADELMRKDPAIEQGIMKAELFPFSVALWSRAALADPGERKGD